MKKIKKIEVGRYDIITYFLVTLVSHLVGMLGYSLMMLLGGDLVSYLPKMARYIVIGVIYIPLIFAFCTLGIFLYFRKMVPKCYENHMAYNNDRWLWLKNCLVLVLPGELVRGLIFTFNIGLYQLNGCIGLLEATLYERAYLVAQGRKFAVAEFHTYIPMDYIAAALCFVIVAAIHIPVVVLIFRYFWKKAEKAKSIH